MLPEINPVKRPKGAPKLSAGSNRPTVDIEILVIVNHSAIYILKHYIWFTIWFTNKMSISFIYMVNLSWASCKHNYTLFGKALPV